MNRTFEHRISYVEVAGAIIIALIILWCFWDRTTTNVIVGCIFIAVEVLVIDRLLNTIYVISDGIITIKRGRFGGKKAIKLLEIERVERVKTLFTHYVLVEYAGRKHVTICTVNEDEILRKLRQNCNDED
ncbi:PH domain-containing protein [Prevotella sp. OH937_COT-195]|uniref:PH domain-containing protein n=1 Tax=Prevotella sp. OH937_COT-195 TaxID=2491051 RepID=UPI000F645893|nr:PH domain-containing protein [Prevotella sp. OH937_COT-195]RRD02239.1 hypothetical protein EII32_04140 [Prevotella sp. OH937_COT-195]